MASTSLKFRTTLLKGGKTATGIEVPTAIVERLGAGKRPAVKIRLNDYTYRSTVAVMGGKFMIGVSAEVREKAHVEGGDTVNVELELDTEPRVLELPADFKKALSKDATAKKRFEALSYSKKQRLVIPVDKAKAQETRTRNIAKAMAVLRSGGDLLISKDPFDVVREVGLGLPDVEAATKYDGSPVLKIGGSFVAGLATHPSAEPATLVVRSSLDDRTRLIEDAPETYYLTDYYEKYPLVLVRLSHLTRDALRDLLLVSRRLTLEKSARRKPLRQRSALS